MQKRLIRSIVLIAGISAAGLLMVNNVTANQSEPNKPILYMTPSEIFSNPKLRQLAEVAQRGEVDEIKKLIAEGVNVNGRGKYGITPLYSAAQAGNKAGYKALLDHGADPNVIWTTGDTLMNITASSSPDPYFMRLALEHGGNPNLVAPRTGATPLLSAWTGTGKVNIPVLIKAGANLNQQMPISKDTATMEAALNGQYDAVYELLKAGANYKLENSQGWDIRDFIKSSYDTSVPLEQQQWRKRVIAFLKEHDFWHRIPWPENPRTDIHLVTPGEVYTLSWDKVSEATSYDLRLNQHVVKAGITATDYSAKAPDVADTVDGLLFWWIRACNSQECSGWSPAITIRVKPADNKHN